MGCGVTELLGWGFKPLMDSVRYRAIIFYLCTVPGASSAAAIGSKTAMYTGTV